MAIQHSFNMIQFYSPKTMCLRLLVFWMVFSTCFLLLADQVGSSLQPLMELLTNWLSTKFSYTITAEQEGISTRVQMLAITTTTFELVPNLWLHSGKPFNTGIDLIHLLLPCILYLSVLFAISKENLRARLLQWLIAIPALFIIIQLTAVALLLGKIDMQIVELIHSASASIHESRAIRWTIFMESGGRWLLPIVLAMLSILSSHWVSAALKSPDTELIRGSLHIF